MAQIMYQFLDSDDAIDVSQNPEIILMTAEGDEAECDSLESLMLAGLAVTKSKSIDY